MEYLRDEVQALGPAKTSESERTLYHLRVRLRGAEWELSLNEAVIRELVNASE